VPAADPQEAVTPPRRALAGRAKVAGTDPRGGRRGGTGITGKDLFFGVVVVSVVGLLGLLSYTGQPRYLSRAEPMHLRAAGDAECLSCHSAGGRFPMTDQHPLRKKNCRQCHRLQKPAR